MYEFSSSPMWCGWVGSNLRNPNPRQHSSCEQHHGRLRDVRTWFALASRFPHLMTAKPVFTLHIWQDRLLPFLLYLDPGRIPASTLALHYSISPETLLAFTLFVSVRYFLHYGRFQTIHELSYPTALRRRCCLRCGCLLLQCYQWTANCPHEAGGVCCICARVGQC